MNSSHLQKTKKWVVPICKKKKKNRKKKLHEVGYAYFWNFFGSVNSWLFQQNKEGSQFTD